MQVWLVHAGVLCQFCATRCFQVVGICAKAGGTGAAGAAGTAMAVPVLVISLFVLNPFSVSGLGLSIHEFILDI